jgi:hypothetical protein
VDDISWLGHGDFTNVDCRHSALRQVADVSERPLLAADKRTFSELVGMAQPCQKPTLRDDCCWRESDHRRDAGGRRLKLDLLGHI